MNKYILVTKEMTWQDAQEYCRQTYGDLATVDNKDDLNQLVDLADGVGIWIGLHDFNRKSMDLYPNSWRWSTQTRSQTGYMNFASGQPNYNGARQECVKMNRHGTWDDAACSEQFKFVCFSGPSSAKTYHHVSQTLSWESAKSYCRTHYTDLAKIENQAENQQVFSIATTYAWIGLSRVPWTWSDGSNGSFRHWLVNEPNNKEYRQFCTLIVDGAIADTYCQSQKQFICMGVCLSSAGLNKYILVTKEMTLQDAQEYCRQTYGDLATVDNMDDLNQLVDLAGDVITWIGLHDFNRESMDLYPNSWRWSTQTRSQTGYMNFASGEPDYKGGREECVMMRPDGTWDDMG
ncbi:hypothetical protein NHX12_014170 [Muraenolepis orangiensis]|uniref:C-type lectin domain-containing protein n=1 Tax=Muraenolepis orangiensis TaxID=630683 RepID=A0A9Q0DD27_9TELE|nr:hypothetical protein NHX12_014170 [Muraenolepis orangiensis]